MLKCKHTARSGEPGLHLVDYQSDPMLLRNAAYFTQPLVGGRNTPPFTLHHFDNDGGGLGYAAFRVAAQRSQVLERKLIGLVTRGPEGTTITVGERSEMYRPGPWDSRLRQHVAHGGQSAARH